MQQCHGSLRLAFGFRGQIEFLRQSFGKGSRGGFFAGFQFHFYFGKGKRPPAAHQRALVQRQLHGAAFQNDLLCQTGEPGRAGFRQAACRQGQQVFRRAEFT